MWKNNRGSIPVQAEEMSTTRTAVASRKNESVPFPSPDGRRRSHEHAGHSWTVAMTSAAIIPSLRAGAVSVKAGAASADFPTHVQVLPPTSVAGGPACLELPRSVVRLVPAVPLSTLQSG